MNQPSTDVVAPAPRLSLASLLRWLMLLTAAVFFALHFLHLNADFPNHSPWVDWSKYTDEGWYGDAAIRHYLTGHWYWPGDFNPAVALPIWPALELLLFRFTGVSAAAARALTLGVFALTLATLYLLLNRFTTPRNPLQLNRVSQNARHPERSAAEPHDPEGLPPATTAPTISTTNATSISLAAPLAILLLCVSPFFYVFERMAILEPLIILLTLLSLLAASYLQPPSRRASWLIPAIALGLLLPALVLTKTTAVALFPAVAWMIFARARYRLRDAVRLAALPTLLAAAAWLAYFFLFVRPRYLADYRYLFSANAYTNITLEPFASTILNTFADGIWMGRILYILFFVLLALALFWRPRFFRNPLVPALLLWIAGYFAFLAWHNNLQPRYYLVIAAPITLLVALGLDFFRQSLSTKPHSSNRSFTIIASVAAAALALAILVPDAILQLHFIRHPQYTFLTAARSIQRIVLADPHHSHLILSISGSDLTLMTGLPSIDDDFGTLSLDDRVRQYRPGWFVAWNELDDDKMDALTPVFHPVRVAQFPTMDDPDRNLLILYRLDPSPHPKPTIHHRKTLHP